MEPHGSCGEEVESGSSDDDDVDDVPFNPSRRRRRRCEARAVRIDHKLHTASPKRPRSLSAAGGLDSPRLPRKRLRKRQVGAYDAEAGSDGTGSLSTSSSTTADRWPVQCFLVRKSISSEHSLAIELPVPFLSLASLIATSVPPARDLNPGTPQITPRASPTRGVEPRARFSKEEDRLLVKLKRRTAPRLSWREMSTHFPYRTTGSLQVRYGTQLKGWRGSSR